MALVDDLSEYCADIYRVHAMLVVRYLAALPKGSSPVRDMCRTFLIKGQHMPPDKQGRWVGYIQSTVIAMGLTTVEEERNISRPMFHKVYEKYGLNTLTINVGEEKP